MRLNLQISASKETIDHIIEKLFSEMHKQLLTDKERRSLAATLGWETRRENAKSKGIRMG